MLPLPFSTPPRLIEEGRESLRAAAETSAREQMALSAERRRLGAEKLQAAHAGQVHACTCVCLCGDGGVGGEGAGIFFVVHVPCICCEYRSSCPRLNPPQVLRRLQLRLASQLKAAAQEGLPSALSAEVWGEMRGGEAMCVGEVAPGSGNEGSGGGRAGKLGGSWGSADVLVVRHEDAEKEGVAAGGRMGQWRTQEFVLGFVAWFDSPGGVQPIRAKRRQNKARKPFTLQRACLCVLGAGGGQHECGMFHSGISAAALMAAASEGSADEGGDEFGGTGMCCGCALGASVYPLRTHQQPRWKSTRVPHAQTIPVSAWVSMCAGKYKRLLADLGARVERWREQLKSGPGPEE
jgi:hypothetical protein